MIEETNNLPSQDVADSERSGDRRLSTCSESSSLNEVLAGNALFFLLDLRPLYDFVNNSDAPRNVKDCLRRINLAAASIEGALGSDGYTRAKARDEKMKSDLEQFLSQNAQEHAAPLAGASVETGGEG